MLYLCCVTNTTRDVLPSWLCFTFVESLRSIDPEPAQRHPIDSGFRPHRLIGGPCPVQDSKTGMLSEKTRGPTVHPLWPLPQSLA
jgi:hypothetical protein